MILVYLGWEFLKSFRMKQNQGVSHLASIFILPILVIGIFYAPFWLKIILILLLFSAAYYLYKSIFKK